MIAPTEFYSGFPANGASRAQGTIAQAVSTLGNEVQRHFLNTQSIGGPIRKTITELDSIFRDCDSPDWDGYHAMPVRVQTYQNSRRFLEALNGSWLPPSGGVDPDGEISFEWYRGPRLRFSVSIGPEATIVYAGMFGTNTVQGTETFIDELPVGIGQNLRRLFRLPAP